MSKRPIEIADGKVETILGASFAPVVAISELIKNASDACIYPNDIIRVSIDTENKIITIKDNGNGISDSDIENLRRPGISTKMVEGNRFSKIGEPYAGSKGLGILTAFSLCSRLEATTYSQEDKCSYKLNWENGAAALDFYKIEQDFSGTELVLHGVSNDSILLLVEEEELAKLLISTITYYISSDTLPHIEFYIDGVEVTSTPSSKIDDIYKRKNTQPKKKKEGYFVAKAQFKYSNNKLQISYSDNEKNVFTFKDEVIDLANFESLKSFTSKYNLSFRHLKEIWKGFDKTTQLDDFEGCYYIWRDRRDDELNQYPYGVRIYVNNYGLYRYLNKDDDWLKHSEISQNIKNTNYKMRNTYGYVLFKNYDEQVSGLKISNDRNDFNVNLYKSKFMYIMKNFVSGIFSYIDIAMRKYSLGNTLMKPRYEKRNLFPGQKIEISELVVGTVPVNQISIAHDEAIVFCEAEGFVYSNIIGTHKIYLTYEDINICIDIEIKDPTPRFSLIKNEIEISDGTSLELMQFINKSSIVNIPITDITISSDFAKIKDNYFTKDNNPDDYVVTYSYFENHHEIINKLLIKVRHLRVRESKKIKDIFPKHKNISKYFKIKDVISDIAECHTLHPTICIIGIRTLIEISLKAFQEEIFNEQVDNSKEYDVDAKIKWVYNCVSMEDDKIDKILIQEYKVKLASNYKKTIKYYKELSPNMYIHEHDTIAGPKDVYVAARRFSLLLNFIIDALLLKQRHEL